MHGLRYIINYLVKFYLVQKWEKQVSTSKLAIKKAYSHLGFGRRSQMLIDFFQLMSTLVANIPG